MAFLTFIWKHKGVHSVPLGISLNVNVIKIEHIENDVSVNRISSYTMRIFSRG